MKSQSSRQRQALSVALVMGLSAATACGSGSESDSSAELGSDSSRTSDSEAVPFFDSPIDFDLGAAETDAFGNSATPTDELQLTSEEISSLKSGGVQCCPPVGRSGRVVQRD